MFKASRRRKQFLLFLVDIVLLTISIPIALFLRSGNIPSIHSVLIHLTYFSPTIVFWIIVMYTFEFYMLENLFDGLTSTVKLIGVALLSLLFSMGSFYLLFSNILTPKRIMALYITVAFILIFLWRYLYNLLYLTVKTSPNVLFIGYNNTVGDLIPQLMEASYCRYEPVAIFDDNFNKSVLPNKCKSAVLKSVQELNEFIKHNKIDIIVLGHDHALNNDVRKLLFSFLGQSKSIYSLSTFYEIATRKLPLGALNDTWVLSHINLHTKRLYFIVKRAVGFIFATLFFLIFLPFFLIVAIIIKLESKGPVFFTQIREGKDSKPFSILKFRTMKIDNNDFKPTTKNDSRITRVGKFLRKTRIDEIPQMINIIKGDMALIGPRPERPEIAVNLESSIPFYRQRLLVKPGITGWDQVSGEYHSPSIEDTIKKMQYDLFYVKNVSLFLDVSIFFKTITTMFKRSGQ
ncbi:MAG: sugar transferase [Treponema sp.]|nr:MAG: sugar transferase [Treponema sp.]